MLVTLWKSSGKYISRVVSRNSVLSLMIRQFLDLPLICSWCSVPFLNTYLSLVIIKKCNVFLFILLRLIILWYNFFEM